jgi:CheY-like chemotaxis protein
MTSAAAVANNPQRIAQLVAQLTDPSAEVREVARNDLAAVGRAGVVATLEALARENERGRRAALVAAAAEMRPLVDGPLLAMLSTSDPALRADVSRLLEHLAIVPAIPFLQTSVAASERALAGALARYAAGTPPFALDESNQAEIWHWDDTTKQLRSTRYAAEDARVIWSARLARRLAQLRPQNPAYQRQAWLLGLESAGAISTTRGMLSRVDTGLVNDVLGDALAANYHRAAAAAADELGRRKDPSVLYTAGGQLSPLAAALVHPNRQVRFAALRAILSIDPTSPYAGSSQVPEALSWFAQAGGERRALVAMPTNLDASDVAGMLAAHGLETDATNRGRDALDLASRRTDLEMIFVDLEILDPEIRQVLYELRIEPATAQIPIAILAADGRLDAATRLASEHQRVLATSRPHSPDAVARILERFSSFAGHGAVPARERATQAAQAIDWLTHLLSGHRKFYDLTRVAPAIETALYQPRTATIAVAALAKLGTPESQRTLINIASQSSLAADSRRHAAEAFRTSVGAYGVLLTTDEILSQYDRYNASATADAQTQQILGSVLDAIESRRDAHRPFPSGL